MIQCADMNGDTSIINFQNVNKYFFLQHQKTIKEFVQALFVKRKTLERVHALKDISFEIKKGEAVGIIGRNGAGKSTMLKLIAGVSSATTGKAMVVGRVAPLIELGAGFHPELSGRENVYLNGVILGLKEDEIKKKFHEIVAFAEVEKFIDVPVKHYSSGMYARLAFSVATSLDPEILLVDEILSVGDAIFQDKCIDRMNQFKKRGVTIIIVTHSMAMVSKFCDRVLCLDHGKLIFSGKTEEGVKLYGKEN